MLSAMHDLPGIFLGRIPTRKRFRRLRAARGWHEARLGEAALRVIALKRTLNLIDDALSGYMLRDKQEESPA